MDEKRVKEFLCFELNNQALLRSLAVMLSRQIAARLGVDKKLVHEQLVDLTFRTLEEEFASQNGSPEEWLSSHLDLNTALARTLYHFQIRLHSILTDEPLDKVEETYDAYFQKELHRLRDEGCDFDFPS